MVGVRKIVDIGSGPPPLCFSKKEGMPKTKKKTVEVLETSSTIEVDTAMLKIDSELSNRGRESQGAH